ncbi:MAG: LytTR family DNA-binding domain-containing protein [Bacilli bacterium]|nr:LytTR family DNA-binding domain-containing protein [Bacilli bacterium]
MKVLIEEDNQIVDDEIIIKCNKKNYIINKIENYIKNMNKNNLIFYKNETQYFFDINDILFFETIDNSISAHTINDIYIVKYKLYELENILPINFIRISKSAIVNINHIYAIDKNITSSSLIKFNKSYKQVYVSRLYNKSLKERLKERMKI